MKKLRLIIYMCFSVSIISCNDDVIPTIASDSGNSIMGKENVEIDIKTTYQTIESFSASDCWMPNYIGKYWSETEKENIAKLLFSREMKDNKPEGIGLSGWRFNLGGGSAQQGDASGIEDISRRAESFMNPNTGTLDWTKQQGQQFFIEKAKEYGCEQFVMFSNTPPVYLTKNGKGFSNMGAYSNLKDDRYRDFAQYISTVIQYFKDNKGIDFSYVSPVNEPQYNWDNGQEGSGWQNSEIKRLTEEIDKAFTDRGIQSKILLGEAGAWNYLYETDGDTGRKNVIYNFFDKSSPNYIGDLTHVAPIIAGHSYWTDGDWETLIRVRSQVSQKASLVGLRLYQTEWSMLGDGYRESEFVGFDKASYMDIALYMSKVIHGDLVYANVSSWSFWTSVDVERWGHKNRFLLIKATPAGGPYADITQSGSHEDTKTLWVLGNYSLFIKPGYKRLDLKMKNSSKEFFGSGYIAPDDKKIVCVYSNLTKKQQEVLAKIEGVDIEAIETFTTNQNLNLEGKRISDLTKPITIMPNSVSTIIYHLR